MLSQYTALHASIECYIAMSCAPICIYITELYIPQQWDIIIILLLQVNLKFCELKGGNIGIVEKAQETRFGMSPKYSRYIGIAS